MGRPACEHNPECAIAGADGAREGKSMEIGCVMCGSQGPIVEVWDADSVVCCE